MGRPTDVYYGATAYLSSASYHPNGKLASLNRGTGGTYQQNLNARQLVSYIGGNWGTSLSYGFDAAGRITSIDSPNNSYDRNFTYDGAGRLKTASGPWGSGTYSYDRLGNILQRVEGPRTVTINYTSANRVNQVQDTGAGSAWRSYAHDARGNVTADGLHTFTYDFANQPISVAGTDAGSFVYDGNLKRVKQVIDGKTIYSIYDRSGAILTRDDATANEKTDFITLGGQIFVRVANGTPSYPLNDHLGSGYMVADQSGGIMATNTYNFTPFGEGIGNDPGSLNKQGYTGHIEDETGLTYMQARYYDPVIGRFLSTDPIGFSDQLNLYAYVGNDPINSRDPLGLEEEEVEAFVPDEHALDPPPLTEATKDLDRELQLGSQETRKQVLTELRTQLEGKMGGVQSQLDEMATGDAPNEPDAENPGVSEGALLEGQINTLSSVISNLNDMISDADRKIGNANIGAETTDPDSDTSGLAPPAVLTPTFPAVSGDYFRATITLPPGP